MLLDQRDNIPTFCIHQVFSSALLHVPKYIALYIEAIHTHQIWVLCID